jgi:uncharacterized protein
MSPDRGGIFDVLSGTELTFESRRVVPRACSRRGFEFEFPDWPAAARELAVRWRAR